MNTIGIGSTLRRERIGRELTLDDIHLRTRIPLRFLQAIEEDDFDRLPGLIFARNFVRQYGEAMGFDPTDLLAAIPAVADTALKLPDPPPVSRFHDRDARNSSSLSSIAWLLMAIAAGAAGYLYFNRGAPAHAAEPAAVAQLAAKPETKPATNPERVPATVPQAVEKRPADAPDETTDAVQVVISARVPSWVSLTADGKSAFRGTMAANETKEFSATSQVKLVTGNAGALKVSLNGKALDPLGPDGQVRVLRLTAEGPEFLSTAPRQTPDDAL